VIINQISGQEEAAGLPNWSSLQVFKGF